jgi:hypothetical protein
VNDVDYYCDYCERGYAIRYSYDHHLRIMHSIDVPIRRPGGKTRYILLWSNINNLYKIALKPHKFANPDLEPDILDPNNYCRVCETKFRGKSSYRIHLVRFHDKKEELLALGKGKSDFYANR